MKSRFAAAMAAVLACLVLAILVMRHIESGDTIAPTPFPSHQPTQSPLITPGDTERAELYDAVVAFENAYHTYSYADAAATRLERIQPYATAPFLEEAEAAFATGSSLAEQSFSANRQSLVASVEEEDIFGGEFIAEDKACVHVSVTTQLLNSTGAPAADPVSFVEVRYWVKAPTGWQLLGDVPAVDNC